MYEVPTRLSPTFLLTSLRFFAVPGYKMGSKLDWSHKVNIWELHYLKKTPIDKIRREFQTGQDGIAPSWDTVRRVVEEFPSLSQAQVRQLPDSLQERWRELQSEAEQSAPEEPVIRQEPYEETLHKLKIRELGKALAVKVSLPSLWDKDLWRDLPLEFQPGKYSLPIGVVEISEDKQIKVNYYDIGAGVVEPHLVQGLYSHLSTSGLSRFVELVGDKGKLNNLVAEIEQYSLVLLAFLKLITDKVAEHGAKVNFRYEARPGLTRWFILTVWNDAIQKVMGHSWIDDSWYKPHENIPNTGLWTLNCGAYTIGIAKSKRTLKTYENWHKKLRVKHAQHSLAKDIAAKSQELNNMAQDIRQRLQVFVDMEQLPGHCGLCTRAGENEAK